MQIIGCSDLDGSNRKFLLEGVKHPYGLTVFGNDMYWTDWQKMSIMKANKFSGGDVETLRYNLSGLMDIHAVQLDSGGTVSKGPSTHNSSFLISNIIFGVLVIPYSLIVHYLHYE